MSRARFPFVLLAALIIMGLVIVGGFATYRIGWSEGYRIGQLATGVAETYRWVLDRLADEKDAPRGYKTSA